MIGKAAAFIILPILAFFATRKTSPSQGGGFIETRNGIVFVRTNVLAWTMQALAQKGIAPTPAGDAYKPGTAFGTLRDDGGLNAAAWANQMQSNGLDVAITAGPDASSSATGMLACFPTSERRLWCAPGKGFALLLPAAAQPQPAPSRDFAAAVAPRWRAA